VFIFYRSSMNAKTFALQFPTTLPNNHPKRHYTFAPAKSKKVFEIKLYGEVVSFADLQKEGFVNLSYLQKQLQKAGGKDVKVRINSVGGDVDEGFAMYSELRRYAKENNAKITTLAEGRCASIATIIFLAGDVRIVTEYTEPFVHNAWCYTMGNAKKINISVCVKLKLFYYVCRIICCNIVAKKNIMY